VRHVVDGGLLWHYLVPEPDTFWRSSQYSPNLFVEPIGNPAQATFEFSLLQHVDPAIKDRYDINLEN